MCSITGWVTQKERSWILLQYCVALVVLALSSPASNRVSETRLKMSQIQGRGKSVLQTNRHPNKHKCTPLFPGSTLTLITACMVQFVSMTSQGTLGVAGARTRERNGHTKPPRGPLGSLRQDSFDPSPPRRSRTHL